MHLLTVRKYRQLKAITNKATPTSLKRPVPDTKDCEHTTSKVPGSQPGLRSPGQTRQGRIMSNDPEIGSQDHRSFGDADFTRSSSGMEDPTRSTFGMGQKPLSDPSPKYPPGKGPLRNGPHTASGPGIQQPSQYQEQIRFPGMTKPSEETRKGHLDLNGPQSEQDQGVSPCVPVNGYQAGMPGGLEAEPEMLLQPETRPISHEQLVIEVKGIYAGLVMVEAKCIDIDERQSAAAQGKDSSERAQFKNDQWQSLIALHKQLLHEHHDFFLASQHPSASPALSRLATKYSMPTRMWRHGIHAFLEVRRHRLPDSLEHMLAFIYIAYTMMALLYETVSPFEDTWIECLGDLGRYRMAIEDTWIECLGDLGRYRMAIEDTWIECLGDLGRYRMAIEDTWIECLGDLGRYRMAIEDTWIGCLGDLGRYRMAIEDTWIECLGDLGRYRMAIEDDEPKDREVWSNVARFWYNEAVKKSPNVGRLYHHLAILARPFSLDQLSLYTKSLNFVSPFESARGSIMALFSPVLRGKDSNRRSSAFETEFIRAHGILVNNQSSKNSYQSDSKVAELQKYDWLDDCINLAKLRSLFAALSHVCHSIFEKCTLLDGQLHSYSGGWRLARILFTFNLILPTIARSIPNHSGKAEIASSIAVAASSLTGLPYLAFIAGVLSFAFYVAALKDPITVWGCMMSVWAFGWWAIKDDTSTTLWDCGT